MEDLWVVRALQGVLWVRESDKYQLTVREKVWTYVWMAPLAEEHGQVGHVED